MKTSKRQLQNGEVELIIIIMQNTWTKYKEDKFASIVKTHESNQPNMKSTIKTAAKFVEE
jgi:hypothetical protein